LEASWDDKDLFLVRCLEFLSSGNVLKLSGAQESPTNHPFLPKRITEQNVSKEKHNRTPELGGQLVGY
jgi:hypothetical protein